MPVTTSVETITPTKAQRLLQANRKNRKVRDHVVARYARDMQNGQWDLSGDAIRLADDGTLIDGQHRLHAAIKAGVAFDTVLVRGLAAESMSVIDTGVRRSFSDLLKLEGEVSAPSLAAAITTGIAWDEAGSPAHRGASYSHHERMAWLNANPDIREGVRIAGAVTGAPLRLPVSVGGPIAMKFGRIDVAERDEFFHALRTGSGLAEGHPVFALRSWLISQAANRGSIPRQHHAAITIKAWNALMEGRQVQRIAWKQGLSNREDFPKIRTLDGGFYEDGEFPPVVPATTNAK